MTEDWRNGGFGLYVHWPFCQAKCPYCDFNSHVASVVDQSVWAAALVSEIRRHATLVPDRVLNTIFFGGGTPSLMDPDVVAQIIEAARVAWPTSNDMEITLEANPTSVEAGRFAGYRDAGVNRISMGIQALNDEDLRALGRLHSVAEARAAFDIAKTAFDRVSFDLIYGRQNQGLAAWRAELREALSMAVDHLSLYQLTIEDGTAFGDRYHRGRLPGLPDEDLGADLYEATQQICAEAGMTAYEVSNHAAPDAQSRHNLVYWRYGDYVGIGPGAHGRLTIGDTRLATENILHPGPWLAKQRAGEGHWATTGISPEDQGTEFLLMGLRLSEGVALSRFEDLTGRKLRGPRFDALTSQGLVEVEENRLRISDRGRPVLNAVLRELLVD